MNQHTTNCTESACDGRCMEQSDRISTSAALNALIDDATDPNKPHLGIESVGDYLRRLESQLDTSVLSTTQAKSNKVDLIRDLAKVLNSYGIDVQLDMPDDVIALMMLNFMTSMAKARIISQRRKHG